MPSLLKGVSIKGFGFNNFLVIGVLSLLVVALFLIPEFVGWQRSAVKTAEAPAAVSDELEIELAPEDKEAASESPLRRLSQMMEMDSGKLKRPGRAAAKGKEVPAGSRSKAGSKTLEEIGRGVAQPGIFLGASDVSWGEIRSSDSVRVMKEAQKAASALAKDLGSDYPESRFALFNFADGISRVLQSNENLMKASEAVAYLNALDGRVTETMIRERVERSDFLKWADVSLGPIVGQTAVAGAKSRYVPAFNPQLTLTFIRAKLVGDVRPRQRPKPTLVMSVRGYVVGKEIRQLALYEDDRMVRRLGLRRPDEYRRRFFRSGTLRVGGVISLVAKDRSGEESRAYYDFKNRVQFFARGRSGQFLMPFGDSDPRVDSFFRMGRPGVRRGKGNLFEGGGSGDSQLVPF